MRASKTSSRLGTLRTGERPKFKARGKTPKIDYQGAGHVKPSGRGRLRKSINWRQVEKELAAGITPAEVAHRQDLSEPTLRQYKEFLSVYRRAYAKGNITLRHTLFNEATKKRPNTATLLFLAKTRLGMNDNVVAGDPNNPIRHEVTVRQDLTRLSFQELQQLLVLLEKAEAPEARHLQEPAIDVQAIPVPQPRIKVNGRARNGNP